MVPAFTLGIPDTSPLELAEAYATFAARGKHCDALPVTKIADNQGNVLKEYKPRCTQELPSPVADAVNDVLEGVIAPGGFADEHTRASRPPARPARRPPTSPCGSRATRRISPVPSSSPASTRSATRSRWTAR